MHYNEHRICQSQTSALTRHPVTVMTAVSHHLLCCFLQLIRLCG